jgi:hypothetical protein
MPDQAPASIDNPRPSGAWRCANYRGVGWAALVATAVAVISQLASPSIKSFTVGASVGLFMVLLEMIMARSVGHLGLAGNALVIFPLLLAKAIAGINGALPSFQCVFVLVATFAIGILIFRKPLLSRYRKTLDAAEASRALA